MKALKHFAEVFFKLSYWAGRQRDIRGPEVDIAPGNVFQSLIYQVGVGLRSFLELDGWLRTQQARDLFNSRRDIVVSDTTLPRALEGWDMDVLRETARMTHLRMRSDGRMRMTLPTGRMFRPGIIDGSNFGGHWVSALVSVGDEMTCGIDVESYRNRGCERAATRRMMKRVVKNMGRRFVTHLLYDGLMAVKDDFGTLLKDCGIYLLVKTEDERLEPIQWAKEMFDGAQTRRDREELGVITAVGTDDDRYMTYEVMSVSGVPWEGLEPLLNVARVTEKHLKGKYAGKTFVFWVLTTDLTLLPTEFRELAHLRWRVENGEFKELNALVGSKRKFIHNAAVKLAALLIWFIGWTILQAFRLQSAIQQLFEGVKMTKHILQLYLLLGECSLRFDSS